LESEIERLTVFIKGAGSGSLQGACAKADRKELRARLAKLKTDAGVSK
jgi:hypothetical protein